MKINLKWVLLVVETIYTPTSNDSASSLNDHSANFKKFTYGNVTKE